MVEYRSESNGRGLYWWEVCGSDFSRASAIWNDQKSGETTKGPRRYRDKGDVRKKAVLLEYNNVAMFDAGDANGDVVTVRDRTQAWDEEGDRVQWK